MAGAATGAASDTVGATVQHGIGHRSWSWGVCSDGWHPCSARAIAMPTNDTTGATGATANKAAAMSHHRVARKELMAWKLTRED
jgi:hypothetical protein